VKYQINLFKNLLTVPVQSAYSTLGLAFVYKNQPPEPDSEWYKFSYIFPGHTDPDLDPEHRKQQKFWAPEDYHARECPTLIGLGFFE
jgi:hypothetical protein